ncbi:MAG: ABC transporter permease [Coriobacteriales bacterium]|nr:ABC transporter permease [Coriobacteriales bacterium]
MKPKRVGLLLWKEFRQFRRDKLLLPLVFMLPIMQLIMFGYVVGSDVRNVPTAVVDLDHSTVSRSLADAISGAGYFEIVERPSDERALQPLMDGGEIQAAIVIPEGTATRLSQGQRAEIGIVVDGSDSRIASAASGYSAQIIGEYDRKRLEAEGLDIQAPGIDSSVRVLYNPSLRAVNTMIPGLMATVLLISTSSIMAQAVVRERESGTLEQMFTTPITRGEYVLGKVTPYVIIAALQLGVVASVGTLWFRVPFNGSVWTVTLGLGLFVFTSLGIGLLTSLVSRTRQQAQQTVMFILIPSFVLSGFMFPIEAMPAPIVPLTYFIPLRYAIEVLRASWLKGSGVAELWVPLTAMTIISAIVFSIALATFSKRLAD